jgi:hypothetical protein
MQHLKNQYCSNCKRKKLEDRVDKLGVEDKLDLLAVGERLAGEVINRLLDDADIPRKLYWAVSETVRDRRKERSTLVTEALRNNDFSDLRHKLVGCGSIVLIGSPADELISPCVRPCEHEEKDKLSAYERIFFESLAEQILMKSCLLVCPNGSINDRKECCGRREWLERLYERLPEKYKKHITVPNCVRGR